MVVLAWGFDALCTVLVHVGGLRCSCTPVQRHTSGTLGIDFVMGGSYGNQGSLSEKLPGLDASEALLALK